MRIDFDNRFGLGPIRLSPLALGLWIAGLTLALDQLTKIVFMRIIGRSLFVPPETFASGPSTEILPFFSFTLVWNQGMSYGLLQTESAVGRFIYTAFALVILPLLGWWLARAKSLHVVIAVGLVIGGAIGNNLIDRVFYHAVVDFLHFHIGQYDWYVFNVADTAIVFGVLLLIYDAFWGTEQTSP